MKQTFDHLWSITLQSAGPLSGNLVVETQTRCWYTSFRLIIRLGHTQGDKN
jgi:hypothetical protein